MSVIRCAFMLRWWSKSVIEKCILCNLYVFYAGKCNGLPRNMQHICGVLVEKLYLCNMKREDIVAQRQDKKARLQTIRSLIGSHQYDSQSDILRDLLEAGFPCTQTTLSRDMRQLRISKVRLRNGRSVYMSTHDGQPLQPAPAEMAGQRWSVQFSGNIMVVHTPPGHAGMVAYDIDNVSHPYFLGTVAGDDTVMVVMDERVTRDEAKKAITGIVPTLVVH